MPSEKQHISPPYTSFKTFITSIEYLEQGVPNQIDRSIWPTFSHAVISQLMVAYKYLGLINDDGIPLPDLERLVEDKNERQSVLKRIIEDKYSRILALGLNRMSPLQFNKAMEEYDISGSTLNKAKSFLLQAAQYSGIPLNQHLLKMTRTASGPKRKKPIKPKDAIADITDQDEGPSAKATEQPIRKISETGLTDDRYQLLTAIMSQLPKDGTWSTERRTKWLDALKASLDLIIEIIDEKPIIQGNEE